MCLLKPMILLCLTEVVIIYIWATSWGNRFIPYAYNKGADQPAHPCSLISTFVVHYFVYLYNTYTCQIQNFKTLVSFWSWAGQFESYLVKIPRRQVFSWRGSYLIKWLEPYSCQTIWHVTVCEEAKLDSFYQYTKLEVSCPNTQCRTRCLMWLNDTCDSEERKNKRHWKVAGLSPAQAKTGKLCPPSSEWVSDQFQGRLKTEKGEDWAPPFTCCAKHKMGLTPLCPNGH